MVVTLHQKDYVNAYLIMGGAKKKSNSNDNWGSDRHKYGGF